MKASAALYRRELVTPTPEAERHNRETDRLKITGFWRMVGARTKADWPVAIWTAEGKEDVATIFQIGRQQRNTAEHEAEWNEFIANGWLKCIAVERAEWQKALETKFWSDGKPATSDVTEDEKRGVEPPTAGDNQAPSAETLAQQIEAAVERASKIEVTDQESANQAQTILDRLRKLMQYADAERVAEKAPHLEAERMVDAKWAKIREPGLAAGVRLANSRDAWLKAEQRRKDAEAAEENRKRRAEAEAKALQDAKDARARGEAPPPAQVIEEVQPERVKASSAYGRGVGSKKTVVVVIEDAALLVNWFLHSEHPDPDFAKYLQGRAEKAVRAKISLPGVITREE